MILAYKIYLSKYFWRGFLFIFLIIIFIQNWIYAEDGL